MVELKVDPEFQNKIPPLRQEEYEQLRENILSDGEVFEPIITWNGFIIDGHNRYKIVQENPDIKYHIREMNFSDRWEALAWISKNQLGRRNLTPKDRDILIDNLIEARKKTHGGNRGNQYTKLASDQLGHLPKTRAKIAKELGVSEGTVQRAQEFGNGLRNLEKVSPEAAQIVRNSDSKVPRAVIREVPKMELGEVEKIAESIVTGDLTKLPKKTMRQIAQERDAAIDAAISRITDPDNQVDYTIDDLIDEIKRNSESIVSTIRVIVSTHAALVTENVKTRRMVLGAIEEHLVKKLKEVKKDIYNAKI